MAFTSSLWESAIAATFLQQNRRRHRRLRVCFRDQTTCLRITYRARLFLGRVICLLLGTLVEVLGLCKKESVECWRAWRSVPSVEEMNAECTSDSAAELRVRHGSSVRYDKEGKSCWWIKGDGVWCHTYTTLSSSDKIWSRDLQELQENSDPQAQNKSRDKKGNHVQQCSGLLSARTGFM